MQCSHNVSEFMQQDGRKKRTANHLCLRNVKRLFLAYLVVIFTNINVFWSFTRRSVKKSWKFGEKLFQTKLLSRLSHKVCRHLSSPFPLHKFTIYLTETVLSITNNPFGFKVVHYCERRLQISVIHFSVEGDTHCQKSLFLSFSI